MFLIPQQQILKWSTSEFQMGAAQMQCEMCEGWEDTQEAAQANPGAEGTSPDCP